MASILNQRFYGNSIQDWATAIGIIVGVFFVVSVAGPIVLRRLKKLAAKTETTYDDIIIIAVERFVIPFFYIGGVYVGLAYLSLPTKVDKLVNTILMVVYTFFILRIITSVVKYVITSFLSRREDGEVKTKQVRGLLIIINVIIWAVGMVFTLDNLGFNVSTIIAGMGISGIAIALAAQAVLADLFSYFIILFDRPFEIGDYIVFDKEMGTVEYVGVKSTRIRTVNGQILICSNKDLTNARVNNFKTIDRRRTLFTLNVTYQTPKEKLEQIPNMIRDIIQQQELTEFARAHLSAFAENSINFEIVYFCLSPDYVKYMDTQQRIFLNIIDCFRQNDIKFAYPTRTLMVENGQMLTPINYTDK